MAIAMARANGFMGGKETAAPTRVRRPDYRSLLRRADFVIGYLERKVTGEKPCYCSPLVMGYYRQITAIINLSRQKKGEARIKDAELLDVLKQWVAKEKSLSPAVLGMRDALDATFEEITDVMLGSGMLARETGRFSTIIEGIFRRPGKDSK